MRPAYSNQAQVVVFSIIVGSIFGIALLLLWLAKDIQ